MYATLISGDRVRTGDELARRVDRALGGLSALGLRGGDVIAVLMRNDFPFVEISLAMLKLIQRHRITHLHAVPTMFSRLLDLPAPLRQAADVSSLVAVVHGAAMCPLVVKQAMIDWWGPIILEYYVR